MVNNNIIESSKIRFGRRTYFFDIKAAVDGKSYLRITESQFNGEGKDRKYNSFILFPENMPDFMTTLKKAELSLIK